MEGQEGAPQPAPQDVSAEVSPPVEPPKPEKGPGPFRRLWMTVRGQNHQSPGEIHSDLAGKKAAGSEQTLAEMTQAAASAAPASVEASPTASIAPATEPVVPKNDELQQIGSPVVGTAAAGEAAPDVDKMITELQENVKKDAAEGEKKDEQIPAPTTTVDASNADTGEALDAVAASMAKMPEAAASATPAARESQTEEPESKPTNIVDMTSRTGVASVPPNPSQPPTEQGNIVPLPTAGSGSQFESNTPQPVQEDAIGMKNAVDASNASDKADADLAADAQKVIDIQEAKAQRDASQQPVPDASSSATPSDKSVAA